MRSKPTPKGSSEGRSRFLLAFGTLLFFPPVAAQPQILWNRTYGGPFDEACWQIVQGWGDYVMAGYTTSFGAYREDVYLLKIDDAGNALWNSTYDRSTEDLAYCIAGSPDGGFIVGGMTAMTGRSSAYLLRIDDNGEKMWEKTYRNNSVFYTLTASGDGGFVAAGDGTVTGRACDVYVLRIDGDGNTLWEKMYGGNHIDVAWAVLRTEDGGFLVSGFRGMWLNATNTTADDVYLLKIDGDGNTLWEKTYGGSSGDSAGPIVETGDGGFVVAAGTESFGNGREDVWLLRIDSEGQKVWDKTYGGPGRDSASDIIQTFGGYIVAGWTTSFGAGDYDVYILKVDEEGNMVWNMTFGGPGFDIATSVVQSWEGGFLVTGQTSGSPYLTQQRDILVLSGYDGEVPVEELLPLFGLLAFLLAPKRSGRRNFKRRMLRRQGTGGRSGHIPRGASRPMGRELQQCQVHHLSGRQFNQSWGVPLYLQHGDRKVSQVTHSSCPW